MLSLKRASSSVARELQSCRRSSWMTRARCIARAAAHPGALSSRAETRKLLVAELQHLLRLHQLVAVEHALNLRRRRLPAAPRIRRSGAPTRAAWRPACAAPERQRPDRRSHAQPRGANAHSDRVAAGHRRQRHLRCTLGFDSRDLQAAQRLLQQSVQLAAFSALKRRDDIVDGARLAASARLPLAASQSRSEVRSASSVSEDRRPAAPRRRRRLDRGGDSDAAAALRAVDRFARDRRDHDGRQDEHRQPPAERPPRHDGQRGEPPAR